MSESYTPETFAKAENISRAMLYLLWKRGQGPRYYQIGNRRRISYEARLEWQREREAEATAQRVANKRAAAQVDLEDAIAEAGR
jgi:hypothetical protein